MYRYLCILMLLLSACREQQLSSAEMRAILHERNEKLGEYFKTGDATKVVTMYADSAKLCPNRVGEIYIGREAILKFWEEDLKGSKLLEMTTETLTINGNRDVIYETGKTTTKTLYKDSVYVTTVKFANVWKRQLDGNYLLDVDIWNAVK